MGLALWSIVSALAVSAPLGFPKGPDWQQTAKHKFSKEIKDVGYEFPHNTLAEGSEIIFQRVEPNLKRTRALEKKSGKNYSCKG